MKFNQKETMKRLEFYIAIRHLKENNLLRPKKKIFYDIEHLWGWKFYLKALQNLDFKSICSHISSIYLTK